MKKLITICLVVTMMAVVAVNANAAVNLDFTEVDVGGGSQVDLTNQFAAYGVTFDHVYRYIDSRDPWKETDPYGYGYGSNYGWGISNGWIADGTIPGTLGTVLFTQPTPYVTIDWWTITGTLYVDAYDSGANNIDSFSGSGSGTQTLSGLGLISYMTFNDSGGYVQIANMTYAPIPAPGAILLGGIGVGLVGWLRRRRTL